MIFDFRSPGLAALVQDLVDAPVLITPAVRAVVSKGALNVKSDSRARFTAQRAGNYLPHYAKAISYELDESGDDVQALIGPESDMKQGGMGKAVEFGSSGTAAMPSLLPALDDEEPKFLDALGDAAVKVIS